jgi:excisionase family DNA binding protein
VLALSCKQKGEIEMSNWITVEQAAPQLNMTTHAIYRAVREQKFPFRYVKIGRQIRISAADLGLVASDPTAQQQPAQASAQAA